MMVVELMMMMISMKSSVMTVTMVMIYYFLAESLFSLWGIRLVEAAVYFVDEPL